MTSTAYEQQNVPFEDNPIAGRKQLTSEQCKTQARVRVPQHKKSVTPDGSQEHSDAVSTPNMERQRPAEITLPKEKDLEIDGSSSAKEPHQPRQILSIPTLPQPFVSDCLASKPNLHGPEREFFLRSIVFGAPNTGKSSLLASIFPEDKKAEGNSADLVMKTISENYNTKKYQFWVRTLGNDTEVKEILWRTYYKWATAFVFVYDTTNKESFEALEHAIRNVQQIVPKEKFFGIVVGTKSDLTQQREVSYEEGEHFAEKHGLNYFIETAPAIEKQVPQLLPRLDTKLKLTFEAI